MLAHYPSSAKALRDALWIDLLNPTEAERTEVEQATQLRLPTRASIEEIESSSRAFIEADCLYLSTPVLQGSDCLADALATIGFVLSPARLVTVRFDQISAFDKVATSYAAIARSHDGTLGPIAVFLKILEIIVDHAADALEHANAELEGISDSAFRTDPPRGHPPAHASRALHAALRKLGRLAGGISRLRDTLLGIGRITHYVMDAGGEQRPAEAVPRLQAVRADIASLTDYQTHLLGKVQFLLDATLGFINIQQNDIVKALTIVSVVGVPPVLIAGIYGMNFRAMPELSWALGYPFALIMILVSALIPIAWFKWRGWM
jgi:magnesium transporter